MEKNKSKITLILGFYEKVLYNNAINIERGIEWTNRIVN